MALASTPAEAASREMRVDSTTLLAMAEKLVADGHREQAVAAYRALVADPSLNVRAEARFRLAKILISERKPREAAILLRRVIDDHPTAVPPRLELASLLDQVGDERGAIRELRSLSALDLPMNVGRLVDRMTASMRARQPFSVQVEFALAPDSNINRATRSATLGTVFGDFALDDGAKARSGVGFAARTFVQGHVGVSEAADLKVRASVDVSLYRHREFNDVAMDVAAGPELRLGSTRVAAEVGVGRQWFGGSPFQRSVRVASNARVQIDRVSQLRADGWGRWVDNQFNDLQDGRELGLALRYERAVSPRLTVSLAGGVQRFKGKDDAYSTKAWNLGVSAYRDLGRTTVDLGIDFDRLEADDRLALLPQARSDRLSRFHVGAVFRQLTFAGFAPTVRFNIERNRSTVEFHDYRRTRTEFGISRAF